MKKTLVIGASAKPDRYAYIATVMLGEYKHEVYPFGLKEGAIENVTIKTAWPTETDFDTVTLYLNKQNQKEYTDKIIALKPKRVIFNPGTENTEFEKTLREKGIEALEACTLVLLRTGQF
ncbi:MAG: CoA-binding protein [Bacteroidota bacterium]